MRLTYLFAVLTLPATAWVLFEAYGHWEATGMIRTETAALEGEIATLGEEIRTLEQVPDSHPARFAKDALSDFYTRTVEAGEVLGAGVRIESRAGQGENALQFQPLKHGLLVASTAVQAATPAYAAPALFSMLEEEISALPVTIRKAQARVMGDTIALRLEVDVFGR
jgi:hypothetical protein